MRCSQSGGMALGFTILTPSTPYHLPVRNQVLPNADDAELAESAQTERLGSVSRQTISIRSPFGLLAVTNWLKTGNHRQHSWGNK